MKDLWNYTLEGAKNMEVKTYIKSFIAGVIGIVVVVSVLPKNSLF
jgi:hypothetical protein